MDRSPAVSCGTRHKVQIRSKRERDTEEWSAVNLIRDAETNRALSEVRRPPLTGQKDKSCRRGLRTFRLAMRLRPQSRVLHNVLNQLCRPLLYPYLASRDDGSQRYEKRGTRGKRRRASRTQSAAAHS